MIDRTGSRSYVAREINNLTDCVFITDIFH